MLVHGVRGDNIEDMMTEDELEVYGIDWEGLREDNIVGSQMLNNPPEEASSSWIQPGPPPDLNLNEVRVDSPVPPPYEAQLREHLYGYFGVAEASDDESRTLLWIVALAFARQLSSEAF